MSWRKHPAPRVHTDKREALIRRFSVHYRGGTYDQIKVCSFLPCLLVQTCCLYTDIFGH